MSTFSEEERQAFLRDFNAEQMTPGAAMVPGKIEIMPRRPREEMTTLEIAEEAFWTAYSDLQCALVALEGARERWEMVKAHEQWKALRTSDKP